VFREVVVSFLPVGHTHEDIDQLFSRIALYLRKNDATSRLGFRDAIVAGFRTSKWGATTLAGDIESAANLSDWLEQYLAPMAQISSGPVRRDGIYKFHQFKFSMLGGAPIMQVREWCGEDEDPWRGLMPESTHHVVFDDKVPSHEDLVTECPPAQRSTLPTNPDHFVRNAQGEVTSNHTSRTRSGVEAIIRNRKITGAAQADLQRCLALMESTEDLPFHWDMSMYRAHASPGGQASAPVAQGIAALVGLRNEEDASAPSNEDNTSGDDAERKQLNFSSEEEQLPADKDGFTPAPLVVGNIHLVRLEGIDWGLARSVVVRHVVYWVSGEERLTRRGKRKKLPHIYIYAHRIMGPPFIEADGCYGVQVLWLDPVDLDRTVENPLDKRYLLNKRASNVHGKGWDSVPAASLDSWVDTTYDGAHFRISNAHKSEIVSRQQSWILLARDLGDSIGQEPLPVPTSRRKLRPGQRKKQPPITKRRRGVQPQRSGDSDSEPLLAKHPSGKAKPVGKTMPLRNTGKRHKPVNSSNSSSGSHVYENIFLYMYI
jgi:hypothetical protein